MSLDPLSRAVPGESLTQPTTDDIFQPSKTDDLDIALYETIDTIRNDTPLHSDLMNMIKAGVDLESIANVITFGSFSKGQYSPDIAMQLSPLLTIWMHSEAREYGIDSKYISIMNFPEDKTMGNMSQDDIASLMRRKNPGEYKHLQKGAANLELDSFFEKLKKDGSTEPSGSFMDMGNADTQEGVIADTGNANVPNGVLNGMGNADTQEGVIADMGNVDTQDNMERAEEVIV